MPGNPHTLKILLAVAVLAGAGAWMWQTWSSYHPGPARQTSAVRTSSARAERSEELTPEQRRHRQHRALYNRLEMTQEQRREANALETRLTEEGDYREAAFRRELREVLTEEQVGVFEEWLRQRREARQARQGG